jgi:hypothetical protein
MSSTATFTIDEYQHMIACGAFVGPRCEKRSWSCIRGVLHLLFLDLHPPTPRDPAGIHGAIWEELTGQSYAAPGDKPLTLVAYESSVTARGPGIAAN